MVLDANHQGGYRVRCPARATNVVPAYNGALTAWRAGGPRTLRCSACGAQHPLEDLDFSPPAAFARGAVVFSDVGG